MKRPAVLFCALVLLSGGQSLIGTRAPEWHNRTWINSTPVKLSDLRGKVVLVRFFMDSTCPLCRATAPSLNYFNSTYKDQGLVVIGMYTPKPLPQDVSVDAVRKYAQDYGFHFPVALDNDWATLKSYWLDRVPDANYTSVSFLIDKNGIVRYIHPGGEYCATSTDPVSRKDFAKIEQWIRKLTTE